MSEPNDSPGALLALRTLDPKDVGQIYNGRSGCCCGCNGTHIVCEGEDGARRAKRKINHMIRIIEPTLGIPDEHWEAAGYEVPVIYAEDTMIVAEIKGRMNIIYTKAHHAGRHATVAPGEVEV